MFKKIICIMAALAILCVSSVTAMAAESGVKYYDENGNQIFGSGMYYGQNNCPYFGEGCYYIDGNGNNVYVGGCRIYYSDSDGNMVPGRYYYDSEGNPVNPPYSNGNRNGGCCGGSRWR